MMEALDRLGGSNEALTITRAATCCGLRLDASCNRRVMLCVLLNDVRVRILCSD